MTYKWDNKKPTAQMLGRWQPFHDGHYALFEEINKMEKKEIGSKIFTDYKDRFQIFIGLAILLLLLDLFILERKNKWSAKINLFEDED